MTVAFVRGDDIASYISTIYEDAMLVARENALAVNLVRVYADRSGTATRSNSQYGAATIQSIGETDDLQSQAFTPSVLSSLTPGEAGGQFFLTDTRVETDPFSTRQDASLELGMAVADKIDVDVFGNISSLTGGTLGTSGTTISWGYFNAMQAIMRNNKAPKPWIFVCHPYHWKTLGEAGNIASSSRTNVPEWLMAQIAQNFWIQNQGGVEIFVTTNVPTSGTDAYCGMWSKSAMAYDERRAPRLEPERDASRRGWELNMSTVFGHGTWRPTYGVQGIFDADTPTS